jgi:ribosomal protein L34
MLEFTRVPRPVIGSQSEEMREFCDALVKAAAAGEALHLRTLPGNDHSFRQTLSKWARRHGYRSRVRQQKDRTVLAWLEPIDG